MELTKLSTKGQLILPKRIRDSRSWKPGMEFIVEETKDGVLLKPAERFPTTSLDDVAGCLSKQGKPKTIAQMHAAIDKELRRRHDSGRY